MTVSKTTIRTDLQTRYDLGSTEKVTLIDQFIDETVRDISNEIVSPLNVRSEDKTVAAGEVIVMPDGFDQLVLAYYNSIEIPILDLSDFTTWEQITSNSNYALTVSLDESDGTFQVETNGIAVGSTIRLVYTVKIDDITDFPSIFRDVIFYGASYKYEKFEMRLLPQEYKVTYNEYDRRLSVIRTKQFNQMFLTQKNGDTIIERLKEVL